MSEEPAASDRNPTRDAVRRRPERRLSREELEAVIRRALEIEARQGGDGPDLTDDDVLRIAGEVGLSESSVRQALAEHHAQAPGESLLDDRGWATRLCGPGLVRASRRVSGSADEVQRTLEEHFRAHQSLRLVRRVRDGSLWEPEPGVIASVIRSIDLSGQGFQLAKNARSLELRVVPEAEDRAHVTLTVDLGKQRSEWFWGMGVAGGGSVTAALAVFITGMPSLPDIVALASPLGLAGGLAAARTGYMRALAKMQLVLDGLLDRLEHGEPLDPPKPSWRDWFG